RFQFRNVIINFVRSTAPFDTITYYNFLVNYWRNMWAIIIFALITLGAAGLMYLSTRVSFQGEHTKQKFIDLSYAFIPLSLSVYLAENTFRLVKGLLFLTETAGKSLGKVWEFSMNFETLNQLQIIMLISGFIFTVWAGYLISKRSSKNENELQQSMLAVSITAVVYLFIGVKILTLPIV
ncbi:MAG: hypothetical protein O8C60_04745, partial [Candidatus Methanoperedens sp.]|nr:hypothetical protein [Candidatus Methanoperedens sp.]